MEEEKERERSKEGKEKVEQGKRVKMEFLMEGSGEIGGKGPEIRNVESKHAGNGQEELKE